MSIHYFRDGSDEFTYNTTLHTSEDGIPCVSKRPSISSEGAYNICLLPKDQIQKSEALCVRNGKQLRLQTQATTKRWSSFPIYL